MRGGARPHRARLSALPTPVAGSSDALPEAGEICEVSNASVAQWALHARGRNWFEGRIAASPRLQQIERIP
jgi:hypothetical protein